MLVATIRQNRSALQQQIVRKPVWLKIRPPSKKYPQVRAILKKHGLVTVCEEAACPNIAECWDTGTATFMVLGDTCTRGCRFCHIKTAKQGRPVDADEPRKLLAAVRELGIFDYLVITSVDRDDLPDQGSGHFASCITALKEGIPGMRVEVLIPDFKADETCLQTILDAQPDVVAHNVETVKRLQPHVRDRRANYMQSLQVLRRLKERSEASGASILTKSSLMLGLGETQEEVVEALQDLHEAGVDIVTLGQYLQPTQRHLPVVSYVTPEEFAKYQRVGEALGFVHIFSGPFIRSSYKAGSVFEEYTQKCAKN